jgi:hypothetical protein
MRDFRPLLFQWQEQITKYLTKYLPFDEIPPHLDIIASGTIRESRQTILADHPPAVHDALVALGRVLNLYEVAVFVADNPAHPTTHETVLSTAVRALLAGFNLARALDEDMAQPLIQYSQKFMNAGKQPRDTIDALDVVLDEIVAGHVKSYGQLPNWRKVINRLKKLAEQGDSIIETVDKDNEDEGLVYWEGSDAPTTFKRIRERLTPIRKKYKVDKNIFPTIG